MNFKKGVLVGFGEFGDFRASVGSECDCRRRGEGAAFGAGAVFAMNR